MAVRCPRCNSHILRCMGEAWCIDPDCLLGKVMADYEIDQLVRALSRDNRILAGHSFEVLKVNGRFPDIREFHDRFEFRGIGIMIKAPTAPQAAALWNNLAKDRP
jgi:hypothetical protein